MSDVLTSDFKSSLYECCHLCSISSASDKFALDRQSILRTSFCKGVATLLEKLVSLEKEEKQGCLLQTANLFSKTSYLLIDKSICITV